MKKLVLTAVAACVSMAVTASYAETTKQDPLRVAQADTTKSKKAMTKDPASVSDITTSPGPTEGKSRTPSGKQRKSGPDAKGVDDNVTSPGPTEGKSRTPSGKQRKSGPDAKTVDDNPSGSAKKAEKK